MSQSQASTIVPRGGGTSTGVSAAQAANIRRRNVGSSNSTSGSKPSAQRAAIPPNNAAQGLFSLRLYNDDAPGIRVGPTAVLVTSLVYIALVIMLHIWAKFR
mmetsp:Transcript_17448/g.30379  ORF Transcript_17448/g.30379 Transcript_17448/m.30379 type:complete len:102 (-) Transcript_17448:255-560(-)